MKILFVHGLASSGTYKMASSLRILLKGSEVTAPDVPIELPEALSLLQGICQDEDPDLIVGLSWGGFLAQKLRGRRKLLVNPALHISKTLQEKLGEVEYLSPRKDGSRTFTITQATVNEYVKAESVQFEGLDAKEINLTTGVFGLQDDMEHCGPEFEQHYPGRAHYFPGPHLPNYPDIKKYIMPVILDIMNE